MQSEDRQIGSQYLLAAGPEQTDGWYSHDGLAVPHFAQNFAKDLFLTFVVVFCIL